VLDLSRDLVRMYLHPDAKVSRMSGVHVIFHGLVGEWAFERWSGVDADWVPRIGGNNKEYDFLYEGRTVEVKTSTYMGPDLDLIMGGPDSFKADVVVRARFDLDHTVDLVGWITRKNFEKKATWTDKFGTGPRQVVAATDLAPMRLLRPKPTRRVA
jgi:hypothetical protein